MEIYHGSNVTIESPKVKAIGFYKDFGFGFYCTKLEKQAQRWATSKRPEYVVNVYDYKEDAFWVLTKFKYPTHQIVFCTEKALSTLVFKRSYAL